MILKRKLIEERSWKKYKMFKKISIVTVLIIGILFVGGISGLIWWKGVTKAPSANEENQRFVITKGSSVQKIGNDLAEAGIIKNATAFKIYVQITDMVNKLPPGEFYLPLNLDLADVVNLIAEGPTEMWVTIKEGVRREEIAEIFIESLELTGDEAEIFRNDFLESSSGREGFLFPDTYLFPRDVTGMQAVKVLTNTFDTKFSSQGGRELSLNELVTLASIIERETITDEERPVVAGIYLNRLNAGWTLDADATLQYGWANANCPTKATHSDGQVQCTWWPRPVTLAMKELNSPYNTYKYAGLPPAPIANPGLSSLEAVANPEDSDYWFYLHDADGVIHYGRTLEEHNANVQRYLR